MQANRKYLYSNGEKLGAKVKEHGGNESTGRKNENNILMCYLISAANHRNNIRIDIINLSY